MTNLILGTVQMGLDYGVNNNYGKISFQNSCDILNKAFELGVNTLDTAEAYGNAHQVIGDFHKLNPNTKFKIITKIPHDADFSDIEEIVKKYITDLNVNSIETLMFHSFESYKKYKKDFGLLLKLQEQGLIQFIGVSVYTNEQIEYLLNDANVDVVQLPYNLLDNECKRGTILCKLDESGKIIHTRSAFLQGLFFKDPSDENLIVQNLKNELQQLSHIAIDNNASMTDLALSYCLSNFYIDNVLIGVDSVEQLTANVVASKFKLNPKIISKINTINVENSDLLNPSLW